MKPPNKPPKKRNQTNDDAEIDEMMRILEAEVTAEQKQQTSLPINATQADTVTAFQYTPIDKDEDKIRILILQPPIKEHADGGPIICELEELSLNSVLQRDKTYNALSYMWDIPKPGSTFSVEEIYYAKDLWRPRPKVRGKVWKPEVMLEGKSILVGENLWEAMSQLRSVQIRGDQPLRLWVDALCINQNDDLERNHQVSMMSRIYGLASSVLVWLGPGSKITSATIEFIKNPQGAGGDPKQKFDLFNQFINYPYWSRVWILQEIILAKKLNIYCGSASLTWEQFETCFHQIRKSGVNGNRKDEWTSSDSAVLKRSAPWKLIQHSEKRRSKQTFALLGLLDSYKNCKSSDPRDKVYALIGLADKFCDHCKESNDSTGQSGNMPLVDYTLSVQELSQKLMRQLQEHEFHHSYPGTKSRAYLCTYSQAGNHRELLMACLGVELPVLDLNSPLTKFELGCDLFGLAIESRVHRKSKKLGWYELQRALRDDQVEDDVAVNQFVKAASKDDLARWRARHVRIHAEIGQDIVTKPRVSTRSLSSCIVI